MASMSRTSTIMNSDFSSMSGLKRSSSAIDLLPLEIKKSPSSLNINMLPLEVLSLTPTNNNQTPSTSASENSSNLSDLSWLFELISSNISLITIFSIMTAIIYHAFFTVRTGFSDICFNGSASPVQPQAAITSPFAEESCSGSSELLQWAELLTPAIAPIARKAWNFLLFPVAPIAFSFVIAFNTEKITGWKSGSLSMLSSDFEEEMNRAFPEEKVEEPLVVPGFTRPPLVTERRGSFMVEFPEELVEAVPETTRPPFVAERRGSFMVQFDECDL